MKYAYTLVILAGPLFAQEGAGVTATVPEAIRQEVRRAVVNSMALSSEISATVSEAVRAEVARRVQAAVERSLAKRRAEK